MTNDISEQLDITSASLQEALTSFLGEHFNKIFSAGSWSAGQVSEHIYKFISGVLLQMKAPTVPTSRDPYEKQKALRDTFLDFTVKFQSPEFVLPGNAPVNKQDIREKLLTVFDKIANTIKTEDISLTTTGFELPGFGPTTRAEWIWFGIYHTQRHIRQLRNLHADLNAGKVLSDQHQA